MIIIRAKNSHNERTVYCEGTRPFIQAEVEVETLVEDGFHPEDITVFQSFVLSWDCDTRTVVNNVVIHEPKGARVA